MNVPDDERLVVPVTDVPREPYRDAAALALVMLERNDDADAVANELLAGYGIRTFDASRLVLELALLFSHDREDAVETLYSLALELARERTSR